VVSSVMHTLIRGPSADNAGGPFCRLARASDVVSGGYAALSARCLWASVTRCRSVASATRPSRRNYAESRVSPCGPLLRCLPINLGLHSCACLTNKFIMVGTGIRVAIVS
jgi:hypothetical protein